MIRVAERFGVGRILPAVEPLAEVLRGELAAALATTFVVLFKTPAAMAGVSCGRFGVLILMLVVFSLVAENDLPSGIGRICLAPVVTPTVAVSGAATASRGPALVAEVCMNGCVCDMGCDVATFDEYTNVA